jgi:hypothetical protein
VNGPAPHAKQNRGSCILWADVRWVGEKGYCVYKRKMDKQRPLRGLLCVGIIMGSTNQEPLLVCKKGGVYQNFIDRPSGELPPMAQSNHAHPEIEGNDGRESTLDSRLKDE